MPAAASPAPAQAAAPSGGARPRTFGRFELRQLLGKSVGAMTWLVFDPASGQEMMLTMPRLRPADASAHERWQREVRMAARLDHPNLAPVLEIGQHEQWPFVVVDRALGVTLGEWLAARDQPPPVDSAGWLTQALRGLAFAHEAGTVHGDLQLHTVIVSDSGVVRVMALATSVDAPTPAAAASTAETTRLQAQRAAERDVLACGLLLHRLLTGQAVFDEPDIALAMGRMAAPRHEIARLPWTTPQPIADALRAIANRATSTQERQRYLNARTLLRALDGWIAAQSQDDGGALALLLDRLRSVGHLPALEGVGRRMAELGTADGQRTDEIAGHILLDMALSFELLRQVNSATVQGTQISGNGPVLTVRRAIALLGMSGIRRAAQSLRAWPGPLNDAGAAAMQRTMERVRLAGHVAQMLRPPGYDSEVMYLVAVLQNLGRLLVQYHFPDEAEQIWQLMRTSTPTAAVNASGESMPAQPGMTEQAASFAVLGVDIEAIGAAVARHWGLGEEIQHMIRRVARDRNPPAAHGDADLLLAAASAANDVVDAVSLLPVTKVGAALTSITQRYARSLDIAPGDLQQALQAARIAARGPSIVTGDRKGFGDTGLGTGAMPLDTTASALRAR